MRNNDVCSYCLFTNRVVQLGKTVFIFLLVFCIMRREIRRFVDTDEVTQGDDHVAHGVIVDIRDIRRHAVVQNVHDLRRLIGAVAAILCLEDHVIIGRHHVVVILAGHFLQHRCGVVYRTTLDRHAENRCVIVYERTVIRDGLIQLLCFLYNR